MLSPIYNENLIIFSENILIQLFYDRSKLSVSQWFLIYKLRHKIVFICFSKSSMLIGC